jgi:hypothetical protein
MFDANGLSAANPLAPARPVLVTSSTVKTISASHFPVIVAGGRKHHRDPPLGLELPPTNIL